MSTECARAARVRTGPTRSGGTPFAARKEFMARTIASSPEVAVTPTEERRSCAVVALAPARALKASATPSTSTTTLRMRLFSDIGRRRTLIRKSDILRLEKQNFAQLPPDNTRFHEDQNFRNLRG